MPRAGHAAIDDAPFSDRAILVRAQIGERADLVAVAKDGDPLAAGRNDNAGALVGYRVRRSNRHPVRVETGMGPIGAPLAPACDQVKRRNGIDTFYGETQALFGVSLCIAPGEIFALLGPNGAGKTTTIRSILALTRSRRGTIKFDGQDVTQRATHEIARKGVGWVPDDRRLCPTLTVARNLSIAQKRTRFRSWTVKETCEIFSPLEYLMERECENLSGGEMQMVAIARALVGAPGIVLFDEPSQGLAPKIVGDVLATIRRLKAEGVASLVVEQNVELALSVADRAAILDRGKVVWTGAAAELRDNEGLRQKLLGA